MLPMRRIQSFSALLLLASACASDNTSPSDGQGGQSGGGTPGQAGMTTVPQAGTGGPSGTAGSVSQGGMANATGGSNAEAGTAGRSGSAGAPAGGASGGTGGGAAGGAAGGSGSGGGGAMTSKGCGQPRTLQNGTITINARTYILKVPDAYDNKHPYRLLFAFAESGSSAMSVASRNYFNMATLDTQKGTIFVAPEAADGKGSWSKNDLTLTDDILAQVEGDLCIDTTRIFATGFSFGGAMSLALACQRADVFRGVAFFSGSDLTGSCTTPPTKPIAYYASSATGDSGTGTPAPTSGRVKQAEFAAVNGCTAEPDAITFPAAGQPHKCTNYKGCSAGHPTEFCVFEGDHGWEPKDPGQSTSWDAPEAWKFIAQF